MTENSKNVFHFLHDNHDVNLTAGEIAEKLGITVSAVTGSVNGLVRKGYAVRTEDVIEVEGKKTTVKYIALTDEGMAFDPEKAEAEEAERKAVEKAAKAAAKAAKSAE